MRQKKKQRLMLGTITSTNAPAEGHGEQGDECVPIGVGVGAEADFGLEVLASAMAGHMNTGRCRCTR